MQTEVMPVYIRQERAAGIEPAALSLGLKRTRLDILFLKTSVY